LVISLLNSVTVTYPFFHLFTIFVFVCQQSINEIYIAPLQGNYSEALPAQAWVKIKVLRNL